MPPPATLDKPFTLKLGAAESIDGEGLRIQFERVVSDSRCPKGVQCIRAGEAVIQIAVMRGSTKGSYELKTLPPSASRVEVGRHFLTLVSVEPEPTIDAPPRPADYTATLTVGRIQ